MAIVGLGRSSGIGPVVVFTSPEGPGRDLPLRGFGGHSLARRVYVTV